MTDDPKDLARLAAEAAIAAGSRRDPTELARQYADAIARERAWDAAWEWIADAECPREGAEYERHLEVFLETLRRGEYLAGWRWEELPVEARAVLDAWAGPKLVGTGNHDVRDQFARSLLGHEAVKFDHSVALVSAPSPSPPSHGSANWRA